MAFEAIAVRQVKAETKASPQIDAITITPASAVAVFNPTTGLLIGTPTLELSLRIDTMPVIDGTEG